MLDYRMALRRTAHETACVRLRAVLGLGMHALPWARHDQAKLFLEKTYTEVIL
jgi:hypothetical protein